MTRPKKMVIQLLEIKRASPTVLGFKVLAALGAGYEVEVRVSDGEVKGLSATSFIIDEVTDG